MTVEGSSTEEYSTLPSANTLKQDVGFAPGLRRRWQGTSGLKAVPATESLTWIPKNPVNRRKSLNFRYAKV